MKEDFLHYLWKFKKFDTLNLKTFNDEEIIVLNVGQYLELAGPDFFNAQITIDNQKTGTFLITLEEKYEEYPIKLATQQWLTFVGDRGYLIGTTASTSNFDNPETIEIRDHLIKSIKFLNVDASITANNSTSRFD